MILKVENKITNMIYYLKNTHEICARKYNYLGTQNPTYGKYNILHTPKEELLYLEEDITLITKLNRNYNNITDKSTIVDTSSGIILSIFSLNSILNGWYYGNDPDFANSISFNWIKTDISSCYAGINGNKDSEAIIQGTPVSPRNTSQIVKTSLLCPPYTGPMARCQMSKISTPETCPQLGKIISFSYIRSDIANIINHKNLKYKALEYMLGTRYGHYSILYDNTRPKNILKNEILCTFTSDAESGGRIGNELGIGCGKVMNSWYKSNTVYKNTDISMIEDYITNIKSITNKVETGNNYNEIIIKSWNLDMSGLRGNGYIDSSTNNSWGWTDVSYNSRHQPILGFCALCNGMDDPSKQFFKSVLQKYLPSNWHNKIVGLNIKDTSNNPFFLI